MTTIERATRVDRLVVGLLVGTAVAATILALVLPDSQSARWLVALVVMAGLGVLAGLRPEPATIATMGWLILLGLTRRLLSSVQADPSSDPLLLVAPMVSVVLLVPALRRRALRRPSLLTYGVLAFLGVATLAIVNPSLPGWENATGWLFWGAPLLWFIVGRAVLGRDGARSLITLVAALGGAAAVTGLVQVLLGFPAWDQRWLRAHGYAALEVQGPDTVRPFGWSSSGSEFALLCGIVAVAAGVLAVMAYRRHGLRSMAPLWAGLTVASLAGLVLSGVRTAVLLGVLGLLIVAIAARGLPFHRFVVGAAVGFGCIALFVQVFHVASWYDHGLVGLVRRSFVGLAHPFDSGESTLRHHLLLTRAALEHLDDHPLGYGTAAGTGAINRGASSSPAAAENDLGNAGLAFGLAGVGLVLLVLVAGLRMAWRRGVRDRDVVGLVTLGVAVVSLRFWWNGGHYATAAILWLLLGQLDGDDTDRSRPKHARSS